jgi:hypothetical protein
LKRWEEGGRGRDLTKKFTLVPKYFDECHVKMFKVRVPRVFFFSHKHML